MLDTGFTGDIQVTPHIAAELGLKPSRFLRSKLANGTIATMPAAFALASVQEKIERIDVSICESVPIAGIGFLTKFGLTAIVDCKNRTVALTASE